MSKADPTVLVVEDEPSLVEIYAHWLQEDYSVRTAQDGEEALEQIDDTVDVIVLDRIMPKKTGDEVIEVVRDRDLDCMIVMATAVESGQNLIEAGADAYCTKPITKNELLTAVSQMLDRGEYIDLEQKYFDLLEKRSTLKADSDEESRQSDEEYVELEAQIDELSDRLEQQTESMGDDEFISIMRNTT